MYSLVFTTFMFNSRFLNASWRFSLDMDYIWIGTWICNVFADYKLDFMDYKRKYCAIMHPVVVVWLYGLGAMMPWCII
jgi:hypothetical protein